MIVNVKLNLNDQQLNLIARKLSGKNIKRTATRAEVNNLVSDFIASYSANNSSSEPGVIEVEAVPHVFGPVLDPIELSNPSTDQQVALLQRRVNILQYALDRQGGADR